MHLSLAAEGVGREGWQAEYDIWIVGMYTVGHTCQRSRVQYFCGSDWKLMERGGWVHCLGEKGRLEDTCTVGSFFTAPFLTTVAGTSFTSTYIVDMPLAQIHIQRKKRSAPQDDPTHSTQCYGIGNSRAGAVLARLGLCKASSTKGARVGGYVWPGEKYGETRTRTR